MSLDSEKLLCGDTVVGKLYYNMNLGLLNNQMDS